MSTDAFDLTSPPCPACGSADQEPPQPVHGGLAVARCRACGLEHLAPRPTLAEIEAIYQEQYYDAWNLKEQPESVRRLKQQTSRGHLAALHRHGEPGRILDVGCATGFFLLQAKEAGWDPYGVELSDFAAGEAKRAIGEERVFHGLVEEAPWPDGHFRAVSMMDCIEHVPDLNGVMAAVARLLEPGGLLLITTPYVGSVTHRVMGSRWTHYKAEHLQYFSAPAMRSFLQKHGFETLELGGAKKAINLDYFAHQFSVYTHPLLTPASRALRAVTPNALALTCVPLLLGDMLVVARKTAGGGAR